MGMLSSKWRQKNIAGGMFECHWKLYFHPQTEAALMYDAVYVLAHGLQQVDKSTRLRLVNLSCDGDQAWAFGSSLYNYLNLVSILSRNAVLGCLFYHGLILEIALLSQTPAALL